MPYKALALFQVGLIQRAVNLHIFFIVRAYVDVALQAFDLQQVCRDRGLVTLQRRCIEHLELAVGSHHRGLEMLEWRPIGQALSCIKGVPVATLEHRPHFKVMPGNPGGTCANQAMLGTGGFEHVVAAGGAPERIEGFRALGQGPAADTLEQIACAAPWVKRLERDGADEPCSSGDAFDPKHALAQHFAGLGGFAGAQCHQADHIEAEVHQAVADIALHEINNRRPERNHVEKKLADGLVGGAGFIV